MPGTGDFTPAASPSLAALKGRTRVSMRSNRFCAESQLSKPTFLYSVADYVCRRSIQHRKHLLLMPHSTTCHCGELRPGLSSDISARQNTWAKPSETQGTFTPRSRKSFKCSRMHCASEPTACSRT